jgi:hypothetical protein
MHLFEIAFDVISKKPLLFRSFTGLTVSEFDDIYEEIESKYEEYERTRRQRLSEVGEEENKKKIRKRDVGAGRPFKLKARERLLMLLVYYRLYITYTLSGFLFDLAFDYFETDVNSDDPGFVMNGTINVVNQTFPLTNSNATGAANPDTLGTYMVPAKDLDQYISTLTSKGFTIDSTHLRKKNNGRNIMPAIAETNENHIQRLELYKRIDDQNGRVWCLASTINM